MFRWHNQHFYGILDETNATTVLPPALSYNIGIIPLPVKDARQHARSVKVCLGRIRMARAM